MEQETFYQDNEGIGFDTNVQSYSNSENNTSLTVEYSKSASKLQNDKELSTEQKFHQSDYQYSNEIHISKTLFTNKEVESSSIDIFSFEGGIKREFENNGIKISLEQNAFKDYPTFEFEYKGMFTLNQDGTTSFGTTIPYGKLFEFEIKIDSNGNISLGVVYNKLAFTKISINTKNAIEKWKESLIKDYNNTFLGRWYDEALNEIYKGKALN